jgi:hypothetical protein
VPLSFASLYPPRNAALVGIVAVAATLVVATLSNPDVATSVRKGVDQGVHGMTTVASMIADRSPGERPEGALANLKPKRQAPLHARALPKVRAAPPPASPYALLAGPPPVPAVIPPVAAPLFNTVTGIPGVIVPAAAPGPGGTPGGPPIFPEIPPPGGGGGVVVPPVVPQAPGTPGTPGTPNVPAVPEPASWAMMLIGFALIGGMLRRSAGGRGKSAL